MRGAVLNTSQIPELIDCLNLVAQRSTGSGTATARRLRSAKTGSSTNPKRALRNVYRRQAGTPGLVAVGDSVATTTPTRGRGIAMAFMQVTALLALLDQGADPSTVAAPFGTWCHSNIEPWVADHIAIDGGMVRRWQGEDLDLSIPLTSDLIAAAVEADPRIGQHAAGYFAMTALPETLRPAEPMARAVYQNGWRPPYSPGPTRNELVDIIRRPAPAA